jgi:hypothetical protein
MPLPEWAKKRIHKKDSKRQNEASYSNQSSSPEIKVFRSDTLGITTLQIPDSGSKIEKGGLSASPPMTASPRSTKSSRLSLPGTRHRSPSQNSLPDWTPPDESDPNAERDWEARATKLAKLRPSSMTASREDLEELAKLSVRDDQPVRPATSPDGRLMPERRDLRTTTANTVDGLTSDEALQEAIRLHEGGGRSVKRNHANSRL